MSSKKISEFIPLEKITGEELIPLAKDNENYTINSSQVYTYDINVGQVYYGRSVRGVIDV